MSRADADTLASKLRVMQEVLERKNRELDALHYVWCDGGCERGVHRYQDDPLTLEIVEHAEHQARRLRSWWTNHEWKQARRGAA